MAGTFDISLDSLAGRSVTAENVITSDSSAAPHRDGATFFLETFGCQMNDHDSEKVAGVLLSRGYRQVESPDAASLVLYNTCSIREKAAQKVFSRLGEYRTKQAAGQVIGVLGCVAQQEGEEIFARAPWVSLVCGSASYRKLPELLAQVEAGHQRVTVLNNDTDETFETPVTRRDNPWRAYLTIIEGCDKACAYCVVPFTRGPERSRASDSVLKEVRELADLGYSEVQLLGQTVNSYADPSSRRMRFSELLLAVADVQGIRRVRFRAGHRGGDRVAAEIVQSRALAGAVRFDEGFARDGADLHARGISRKDCNVAPGEAPDCHYHGYHRGIPRRNGSGLRGDAYVARGSALRQLVLVQ